MAKSKSSARKNPGRGPWPEAPPGSPRTGGRKSPARGGDFRPARAWLYGVHAVLAALANPKRRCHRLLVTFEAGRTLRSRIEEIRAGGADGGGATLPVPEVVTREKIGGLVDAGAVHQGVALLADPPPEAAIEDVCRVASALDAALVVVLDRVSDPRNVGAVLRSAAAFDAAAVIIPRRGAPPAAGALAKAASGALELVPLVRVTNLARALDVLKGCGFWCAGLEARAPRTLAEAGLRAKVALVLGSEGKGLRRLVRERCDLLIRLPVSDRVESLNVSAAAAIALYELARAR